MNFKELHEELRKLKCDPKEPADVRFGFMAGVHMCLAVVSRYAKTTNMDKTKHTDAYYDTERNK
jgi:hypothetical protein